VGTDWVHATGDKRRLVEKKKITERRKRELVFEELESTVKGKKCGRRRGKNAGARGSSEKS